MYALMVYVSTCDMLSRQNKVYHSKQPQQTKHSGTIHHEYLGCCASKQTLRLSPTFNYPTDYQDQYYFQL